MASIVSGPLDQIACAFLAPSASGRNVYFQLTRGERWAKLSCPLGAGSSGRMNEATSRDRAIPSYPCHNEPP
jgi:hypothetical protein